MVTLSVKTHGVAILAVTLTISSLLLLPHVDEIHLSNAAGYPLFYLQHLPIAYYVTAAFLVFSSILVRSKPVKLLAIALLAFLVEMAPVLMLANPLVPDQYPFLAEPTWLAANHYIADLHYLANTPGLGVLFSQFMLVTGLGPFQVSKLFPFFGVFMSVLMVLIGQELDLDGAFLGLPAVLFLGFNFWYQTNMFHRQTYSIVLFLVALLLLFRLINSGHKGYFIGYVLVFTTIVLSHPGTPAFMIISLVIAAVGLYLFQRNDRLMQITLLSSTIFLVYYLYVNSWDLPRMIGYVSTAIRSILSATTTPPGTAVLQGYTAAFQSILSTRLAITGAYLLLSSLLALYFVFKRHHTVYSVLSFIHLGFAVQLLLFIYGGYVANMRPLFFLVYTSSLLIPLLFKGRVAALRISPTVKRAVRVGFVGVIAALILVIPALRYSGIPYLHVSTKELEANTFIDAHYSYAAPVYATEDNLPYLLSYLVLGVAARGEPSSVLRGNPEGGVRLDGSYLISSRLMTRDGYWQSSQPFTQYLAALSSFLASYPNYDLVYSGDQYSRVFLR